MEEKKIYKIPVYGSVCQLKEAKELPGGDVRVGVLCNYAGVREV
jgi:hypothetical protein